jgi:uncharacterized protein (DUF302 family)
MHGYTTTLTGITFDQTLNRTVEALKGEGCSILSAIDDAVPDIGLPLPCNAIVREEAPERIVVGFLDRQIMVGLVGKPDVQAAADAAERLLCGACTGLANNGAPLRAV